MSNPRVVAIIQARMAATRLPGKVLADLGGRPALDWVLRRAGRAGLIDQVIVATTTHSEDDAVAAFCKENEYKYFRGSMQDVLDRYYQAALGAKADIVVRITGDCPLIDADMLDSNIQTFLQADPALDFAANRLPGDRTIPIGLDSEICTFAALKSAWIEAKQPHQREHVMPFFYENPERFRTLHIKHKPDYGQYRWTLDTPEDLTLLRKVVAAFEDDRFSWLDVLALFEASPELAEINAAVSHKSHLDVDTRQ
jgi:spore coat polysaccharide biosynthesis protein SpsF